MADPVPALPSHGELVRDLKLVRERGLWRLRRLPLPALSAAAAAAGLATGPDDARAVEVLLRRAVDALGEEEPGLAAQYLFGLVQGTAGRKPTDLRERAAGIYGLSAETFRKEPEQLLVERVAQEVLLLCPGPSATPFTGAPGGGSAVAAALRQIGERADQDPGDSYRFGRYGPFPVPVGSRTATVTVDLGAVEELRDVEILVSSENTYLEPARLFTTTLSGQLRNAAALRDASGLVVRDVVAEELHEWVRRHARPGNLVEPGVVATTSAGALARNGVRRLFHAAVASPRRGRPGYDVPELGVFRAVRRCFELARAERTEDPAVGSISFPLFGAGDGGLDAAESFSRLWPALERELQDDPAWHVHLTTWTVAETELVLRGLADVIASG